MKYFDLLTSKNLKKRLNLSFYEQLFLKYTRIHIMPVGTAF